ncbi:HIT family protein [Streptomyces sp. N50]|uniref:HIT family protein n=1 Tax=Streptomyces sp. N50 TaxID=3081765 RepID=UPI002961EC50|nr:HIT domain-containing protein [Streptomyces sp. N50]WOX12304.1 hypothetical protein R2B38_27250 [Streptomyces sp. N50]
MLIQKALAPYMVRASGYGWPRPSQASGHAAAGAVFSVIELHHGNAVEAFLTGEAFTIGMTGETSGFLPVTTPDLNDLVRHEDYQEICSFCAEIHLKSEHNLLGELLPDYAAEDFILFESDHFVVIPGVGAVCDGYVLISPKEHVLSFGHLSPTLDAELDDVCQRTAGFLRKHYGRRVLAFEHGAESFRNRGGSCTDHAHMHMFPAVPEIDIATGVRRDFELRSVNDFLPALRHQVQERQKPYLWLRSDDGRMWICDAPSALSQYVRRIIVGQLGRADEWDWAVFPGIEHLCSTIETFRVFPNG